MIVFIQGAGLRRLLGAFAACSIAVSASCKGSGDSPDDPVGASGGGGADGGAAGGGAAGGAGVGGGSGTAGAGAGGTGGAVAVLSTGLRHSCARSQDLFSCWGSNQFGQLGRVRAAGAADADPAPALVEGLGGGVRQLALGGEHSCALRDDGRVLCWGDNDFAQSGNATNVGVEFAFNPTPVEVQGLPVLTPTPNTAP